jgi:hypothetical protein
VRPGASTGSYSPLLPRQELAATPNALFSRGAPWAGLSGVPAGFADGVDNDTVGWGLTGNAGTNPATQFLGTTDSQALEMRVNGLRALRLEPARSPVTGPVPNIVGGHAGNSVGAGVGGATIAGGGADWGPVYYNRVDGDAGAIGGGYGNTVSGFLGFVGGGNGNVASGQQSVVGGGGGSSASGSLATVAGGSNNIASANYATVGGGAVNTASGGASTIPGGFQNVAGGWYSLAAGRRARVRSATEVGGGDTDGDQGSWVWADSTDADFASTGPNQFLIRAAGGVGIGTTAPTAPLHVSGTSFVRARLNSDLNAGLGLALNEVTLWSLATVSPGYFVIYNDSIGQGALTISRTDNTVTTTSGLQVNGAIVANSLGAAGAATLCRNASNQISSCSSSRRYKTGIEGFGRGLELIERLRPVSFRWRADGQEDFGLVAEEVAEAEPLLVTRDAGGAVEGVKYDRVAVALVNAVKEQQEQIARLGRESRDVYEGIVTTGADGLAVVELPGCEAQNRDFRYQLTVVGQFAQAIVARKIAGDRFTIQTDRGGVEVSWQVTAARKDASIAEAR